MREKSELQKRCDIEFGKITEAVRASRMITVNKPMAHGKSESLPYHILSESKAFNIIPFIMANDNIFENEFHHKHIQAMSRLGVSASKAGESLRVLAKSMDRIELNSILSESDKREPKHQTYKAHYKFHR